MGRADQEIIAERYQAFPRTLCFITHGEAVLLLRGASDKRIWPDKYNGVGGHVNSDEDVFTATEREIREETGLRVHDLRLRGVINIPVDAEECGVLLFVFTAMSATREVCASEEGAPEWVPLDEIDRLDLVEDLPVLLPRVLAMGPDDPPFYALCTYDGDDELVVTFPSSEPWSADQATDRTARS
jgi:8-oxo-dGTP diphosphatase